MKARGSTMIDCQIDMVWPDTYLEALQRMSRGQEQILRDAQSAQPGDLIMLETLCRDIMTYDSASRGREQITHRRYECQHALEDAGTVITELKTTLEKKVGEFTDEMKQTILKTVSTISKNGQSERAQEEALQACRAYSAVAQVLQNVPELQSQFQQYYLDLARFSFITENQLYDSLLSDYCRAQTPEELKAVQKNFQETVLQPFRKTQSLLREKYSWKYTARILPGWGEYRLIDLALPKRWQELKGEMETVAQNSETFLRQRQDLEKATKELQRLAGEIPAPELNGKYLETIRGLQQRAEKLHYSSLPTKFHYLSQAANHYKTAWETMHMKLSKAATTMHELMEEKLGELETRDYLRPQDLEEGLSQLQHISTVASLESYSLQPGSAPASSPLSIRARQLEQKLQKASLGIKQFSSVVGLQTYLHTFIEQNGWPADTIVPNNIPINGTGANTALERSALYALIIGADAQGSRLPGTLWQRVEQLGVRPNKVVDLMALAAEYVLAPETGTAPGGIKTDPHRQEILSSAV